MTVDELYIDATQAGTDAFATDEEKEKYVAQADAGHPRTKSKLNDLGTDKNPVPLSLLKEVAAEPLWEEPAPK